jgi:hypothetical protein
MKVVDTSVWIDHLNRRADTELEALLSRRLVLLHPFVLGEVAMGGMRQRAMILKALAALERPTLAAPEEVQHMVEQRRLWGTGLSYVDAHLLASAILTPGATILTRDKRLADAAARLGVG